MNKMARLSRSALSIALVMSSAGLANADVTTAKRFPTAENSRPMTAEEQKEALSTFSQLASDDSELMRAVEDQVKYTTPDKKVLTGIEALHARIHNELQKEVEIDLPNGAKAKVPRWKKEVAKLKISLPIELRVTLFDQLRAEVEFEREVEPTNIAGEQVLSDTYRVKLGTTDVLKLAATVRVTFAKPFSGPNAKKEALFSKPKWIKEFPRTTAQVQQKLGMKETVRAEIIGDLGLVKSYRSVADGLKKYGYVGVEKKGVFLAEFYRKSESDVVTRFMGLINNGSLSGNVGVIRSLFGRVLPGNLGEIFGVGAYVSGSTNRLIPKHNIDSMMVIYRFNLSKPEAFQALDEIFANIKNLDFLRIFNPVKSSKEAYDIADELKKQAAKAEALALTDANLPDAQKRVEHEFRGRMTTRYYNIEFGGNLAFAASASHRFGGSLTMVQKFNNQNQKEYYLLENFNSRTKKQAGAGWMASKYHHDLDLLLTSNSKNEIGSFMNLVNRTEWQETQLNQDDLRLIKRKAELGVPAAIAQNPKFQSIFAPGKHDSATVSFETIMGPDALKALQGLAPNYIAVALQRFTENHPERNLMNLPDLYKEGSTLSEGEYLDQKGHQIRDFLDSEDTKKQVKMFKSMKNELFFQNWVLGEFIPSLVPSSVAESVMGVNLRISSDELGVQSAPIGQSKVSDVYKAVKFMRRVLEEDRDFKIRLDEIAEQTDVD